MTKINFKYQMFNLKNIIVLVYPLLHIVIFRLQKAYKKYIQELHMNQEFELKLLLKQNSEMVSRMQSYRRENQQLIKKNDDLNLWVQNLLQVFAAVGGAWRSITNNQQALFNLMKKRSDTGSKAMISKYISHFKAFDEIINRLGEKITNSGHSNEVTQQAKMRLNAFVQNYEMFFKEIVDSYFKFNDQYLQWITQIKTKPQINQNFRIIANKQIENKMKIKQFQQFMTDNLSKYRQYQIQNQHKLIDGMLWQKNQQINKLKQQNNIQGRRLQLLAGYVSGNVDEVIGSDDGKVYQCYCGGRQVEYYKKQWQKHLEELRNIQAKGKVSSSNKFISNTNTNGQANSSSLQSTQQPSSTIHHQSKQEMQLIQFQKQRLFDRISNLNQKLQKMRTQSRLSEELVLGSSAYSIIHGQCGELLAVVDQLVGKINTYYLGLYQIQKAREEEMVELRQKLMVQIRQQVQKSIKQGINNTNKTQQQLALINNKPLATIPKIQTNLIEFKTTITESINNLIKQYKEINTKTQTKQQSLTQSKQFISMLQSQITQLNKRIQSMQAQRQKQLIKGVILEFRHEKFAEVEKRVTAMINNAAQSNDSNSKETSQTTQKSHRQQLLTIWKQFITYVKSRDKKIKDLQSVIKRKEKQLLTKDKLVSVLQQGLKQTQGVFLTAQTQVKKFSQFITNTQKQLHSLAEKNLAMRSEFQQQKLLLSYKTKTQQQAKLKMEEKLRSFELLEQQIKQVKRITHQTQISYQTWIVEQQKKCMQLALQLQQAQTNFLLKKAQCEQKQKSIKKLNQQKQKWKSQCNKLGARFNAIQQKSQMGVIKMQMQEYKRKVMCNCSRDQQRTVVLKTCPHAFCKRCVEDMNNSRNRKCPLCGVKFGKGDLHQIILS